MRIKRLDIVGFKSFPERVQIPFSAGISAVVGPNGCGKSNIVDAIRWVMGEQSPKQLRGRQMDDVLFNGTRNTTPSGMAEVGLTLSNEGGSRSGPALGPSEICITRRLFRSGDSEYLINKVPCRLKDITQFFMDTGMGTKAYAIIEQGRIGTLVDSRPEDRRALIDEAAGITRYKAQKKEAERKIESTEQNLTHINTLMSETRRQINSLTRQARKAAQYRSLEKEQRELDLLITSCDLGLLEDRQSERSAGKVEMETRLTGLLSRVERLETNLEQSRLEIVDQEKTVEECTATLYELQNNYSRLRQEDEFLARTWTENEDRRRRLQSDLERNAEQKDQETRELERLKATLTDLKNKVTAGKSSREEIERDYNEVKEEYEETTNHREDVNRELSELHRRLSRLRENLAGQDRMAESHSCRREEIETELEEIRTESSGLRERSSGLLRQKEDLVREREDMTAEASRQTTAQDSLRRDIERLSAEERRVNADLAAMKSRLATLEDIQANYGWYSESVQKVMMSPEMRAAGIIGPVAESLSVPSGFDTALEAALGERLKFILVRDRDAALEAIEFIRANDMGRCGFISLKDLPPGAEDDLIRALLGDYHLAETLAEGLRENPGGVILTRDGDYAGSKGTLIGGRIQNQDKGLLAQLRDLEELGAKTADIEARRNHLAALRRENEIRAESIKLDLARIRESLRVTEASINEIDRDLSAAKGRQAGLDSRLGGLNQALEQQVTVARKLAQEKLGAESEIRELEEREIHLTAKLEEARERTAALYGRLEETRRRQQQAGLELTTMQERLGHAEREFSKTTRWLQDLEVETASKEKDLARLGQELTEISSRRQEIAESLEGCQQRVIRAEEQAAAEKSRLDELRSALNTLENDTRKARQQRTETSDRIARLELDLQEIGFQMQAHFNRLETEYRLEREAVVEALPDRVPDGFDREESDRRLQELRGKIQNLGEINLTAIGEHQALEERYQFYKDQYEDLTQSIKDLRDSISKINRTCRIRFNETFEAVDQKVREIFPLLFEGGEAWLSLTDENHPLESGVEIHVHPPGKKLTVMSLLSGGEKALVAIALIFALYLIKPSPFCLLDEVDAPLDEANIDRFNRLLSRLGQASQIIMITHNKRTMQISQNLYGVTMEVAGVSKLVSVNLDYLEDLEENAELVQTG